MKSKYIHPAWPPEKEEYLEEAWGNVSIPNIAKKLGKSIEAVKLKARRMGLGRHIHSGDYITLCQLLKALKVGYSTDTLNRWKAHNFPLKHKKSINQPVKVVYPKDFWAWAEHNKMLIDWGRVEPGTLGLEPQWVIHKRKADQLAAEYTRRRPWTPLEDAQFKAMLKSYRYTYRDISVALKRTEGALKRRFRDLKLKERPLIADKHDSPWTPDQVEKLVDLYYKGYIPEVMAEFIPKSASAIKAKIERMVNAGELDKNRYRKEKRSKNLSSGVHYRKALPPEKWPVAEIFISTFLKYAEIAEESGKKLDLNVFMDSYRKVSDQLCQPLP